MMGHCACVARQKDIDHLDYRIKKLTTLIVLQKPSQPIQDEQQDALLEMEYPTWEEVDAEIDWDRLEDDDEDETKHAHDAMTPIGDLPETQELDLDEPLDQMYMLPTDCCELTAWTCECDECRRVIQVSDSETEGNVVDDVAMISTEEDRINERILSVRPGDAGRGEQSTKPRGGKGKGNGKGKGKSAKVTGSSSTGSSQFKRSNAFSEDQPACQRRRYTRKKPDQTTQDVPSLDTIPAFESSLQNPLVPPFTTGWRKPKRATQTQKGRCGEGYIQQHISGPGKRYDVSK